MWDPPPRDPRLPLDVHAAVFPAVEKPTTSAQSPFLWFSFSLVLIFSMIPKTGLFKQLWVILLNDHIAAYKLRIITVESGISSGCSRRVFLTKGRLQRSLKGIRVFQIFDAASSIYTTTSRHEQNSYGSLNSKGRFYFPALKWAADTRVLSRNLSRPPGLPSASRLASPSRVRTRLGPPTAGRRAGCQHVTAARGPGDSGIANKVTGKDHGKPSRCLHVPGKQPSFY